MSRGVLEFTKILNHFVKSAEKNASQINISIRIKNRKKEGQRLF